MDTLFEQQFDKIKKEYTQIDESLGKFIKNNLKHATGKGMGEEVKKTFEKFVNGYHFRESSKTAGMFVKKQDNFLVGVQLEFKDGEQSATGTVLLSLIDKKKNKKLLSDEQIKIKHSNTVEELSKHITDKLKEHKCELSKTDLGGEDDEDGGGNGDSKKKSSNSKIRRAIEDKFLSAGVSEDELDDKYSAFEAGWSKLDDKQQKAFALLIKN